MTIFLIYLFKTSACLIVFYLFFKALFSNDTFFRFNRRILILGTIACFVIPVIKISIPEPSVMQTPFMMFEESLNEHSIISQENILSENSAITIIEPKEKASRVDPVTILIILFFTGSIINLITLLKSFFSMKKIIDYSPHRRYKGYKLVLSERQIAPFSWNRYIVISNEDFRNNPDEIISHEIAHIVKKHSLDILLFESLIMFQWFNPAIWLLKKELKDVHEYQADSSVLKNGIDATRYQLLLVKKAVGSNFYTLANSFNHSKIKKRITMMLKEKSKNRAKWKLLLLLPTLCLMLVALAKPGNKTVISHISSGEVTESSQEPEKYSKEYFQKESDAFIKQLVGDKKLSKEELENVLKKETYYISIFMNKNDNKNKTLLLDSITEKDRIIQFKYRIQSDTDAHQTVYYYVMNVSKPTDDSKPFFLEIPYNIELSNADLNKTISSIKKVFSDNEGVIDRKIYIHFEVIESLR